MGDAIDRLRVKLTRVVVPPYVRYNPKTHHVEHVSGYTYERDFGIGVPDVLPEVHALPRVPEVPHLHMEVVDSPLPYPGVSPAPKRLALIDDNAPAADGRDAYFPKGSKMVAFQDFSPWSSGRMGSEAFDTAGEQRNVYLHYVTVRSDQRGQGRARTLIDELYRRYPGEIDFGQIMEPQIGTLYRERKASDPDRTRGKIRFREPDVHALPRGPAENNALSTALKDWGVYGGHERQDAPEFKVIRDALADAPITTKTLYRGTRVSYGGSEQLKTLKQVTLPLNSFTSDESIARPEAQAFGDDHGVLFHLTPGARAIENPYNRPEREYLSAGTFDVLRTTTDQDGVLHVFLQQPLAAPPVDSNVWTDASEQAAKKAVAEATKDLPYGKGDLVDTPRGPGVVRSDPYYWGNPNTFSIVIDVQTAGQGPGAPIQFFLDEVTPYDREAGPETFGGYRVGEAVVVGGKVHTIEKFDASQSRANADAGRSPSAPSGAVIAILTTTDIAGPEYSEDMRGKPITTRIRVPWTPLGPQDPKISHAEILDTADGRTYALAWDDNATRMLNNLGVTGQERDQFFDSARHQLQAMVGENKMLEKDLGQRSNWSGIVNIGLRNRLDSTGIAGTKDWDCSISFEVDYLRRVSIGRSNAESGFVPSHPSAQYTEIQAKSVRVHELGHALSEKSGPEAYRTTDRAFEEGIVEGYTASLLQKEVLGSGPAFDSKYEARDDGKNFGWAYKEWVDAFDDVLRGHVTYVRNKYRQPTINERLKFYRDLMETPLAERRDRLNAVMAKIPYVSDPERPEIAQLDDTAMMRSVSLFSKPMSELSESYLYEVAKGNDARAQYARTELERRVALTDEITATYGADQSDWARDIIRRRQAARAEALDKALAKL